MCAIFWEEKWFVGMKIFINLFSLFKFILGSFGYLSSTLDNQLDDETSSRRTFICIR